MIETGSLHPIRFEPSRESLDAFKAKNGVTRVLDEYRGLLEELFLLRNPRFRFDKEYAGQFEVFIDEHREGVPLEGRGSWFFFPWNKWLVHYLSDTLHQELRTARNKYIVTQEEQERFYGSVIAIAGLSIGSHAASTIPLMGGGRRMKLADPDVVSGSNLNRMRYDFTQVGKQKLALAAEYIYQLDPYSDLVLFPEGITEENVDRFLEGVDILIEETDSLAMKILLRSKARERRIPVIMATDNGDNIIVDVERFDLDPNLELFNGAAGDITLEAVKAMAPTDLPRLATKIAGPSLVVPRMLDSVREVGKTLYSWPQLADAATLSGVALAHAAKRLALGERVRSGKFEVNLDAIFDPEYLDASAKQDRDAIRKSFMSEIGLD